MKYPEFPGFESESETSAEAAHGIEEFSNSMADRCEQWFKASTAHGMLRTCEECEIAAKQMGLAGRHQSISARIRTDLFITRKCLYKIATELASGRPVKVWYSSNTSGLVTNEKGQIVYQKRPTTTGRCAVVYGWGHEV